MLHPLPIRCDSFGNFDQVPVIVEFKQLFITIVGKTSFDQVFQDHFYLMHLAWVYDLVNFVSYVADIVCSRRETMSELKVIDYQGISPATCLPLL